MHVQPDRPWEHTAEPKRRVHPAPADGVVVGENVTDTRARTTQAPVRERRRGDLASACADDDGTARIEVDLVLGRRATHGRADFGCGGSRRSHDGNGDGNDGAPGSHR